ncbi:MAG TPA: glycine--tRNA ligase subunit beta [Sphingomonas sp.]|uniref:glycine--tRNA ligase subunit beta n=1 Tax=Sphingomonas sp. TaxID=28214 RepID=UPI002C8CCA0F|nr:glycine--tRNA ligase subunit beta [Sphingomonas sp.]HMI19451.1 glycine--tRNA ligase subunit beta [Sphingomonas sp.]
MADFLLELLSEEIPARMQEKASADLQRLFEADIAKAGLAASAIETYATPRRLALIARGLPAATEAVSEETKGPKSSAPPQALEGFLRKTGLTREQLIERDGILFAIVEKPGRATAEVLAEAIPAIVRAFPWPKSMRWGTASASTASLRWVRPLQGIIALLGEDVVPFEIDGIQSGAATYGHRFHHPGKITIGSAGDYAEKLRACHVILDPAERRGIIEGGARALAEARGLHVIPDDGLVAENAGLTEWPVPLLGDFDPAFLEVPREVIQLTMRTNQKYFACVDKAGKLAPNFICTANIVAEDGGVAIVNGNRKVLAARLSDAKFFWEQDLKVPLAEQAKKLDQIRFHEQLGTVADKVERVARLARWLVEQGVIKGANPEHAEQAARLAKADLVTGMVGEFPELQGVMGGYYAHAEGLPHEVAGAIRDHYKPVGQSDEVPSAPVTVAVSLADKLDTIAKFFFEGMEPSGSKDPFALRRSALGVIGLLQTNDLHLGLRDALSWAIVHGIGRALGDQSSKLIKQIREAQKAAGFPLSDDEADAIWEQLEKRNVSDEALDALFKDRVYPTRDRLLDFFADRLKAQQREAGVRHDLIDAVFALGGEDDLVRLLARVKALQAFISTEDGTNLLAGYKRAANILRKEEWRASSESLLPSYTPEPAEDALIAALATAGAAADFAVKDENFEGAMAALATLRGPIDAFFDTVTVNDVDRDKREVRLGLLALIRDAVHRVADFSKIEG